MTAPKKQSGRDGLQREVRWYVEDLIVDKILKIMSELWSDDKHLYR